MVALSSQPEGMPDAFRALLEQDALGIAEVDLEGRWRQVNARFCQLVGRPAADLLGQPYLVVTHPQDQPQTQAEVARLLAGEHTSFTQEKCYLRPDGASLWVQVTNTLVRDAAGRPVGLIKLAQDISRRKQAEQELDGFFAHSPDGVFFMALPTPLDWEAASDPEATLTQILNQPLQIKSNARFRELFGFPDQPILMARPLDFFAHDPELGREVWRQLLSRGELQMTVQKVRVDRTPLWIESYNRCFHNDQGQITGLLGIQRDASPVRDLALSLKTAQEQIQYLLSEGPSALYICNPQPPYAPTYVSPGIVKVVGYTATELLTHGELWFSQIHPEDQARVVEAMEALCDSGARVLDYRFRHRDGTYRWLQNEMVVERDDGGRPVNCRGSLFDITARKQQEVFFIQQAQREAATLRVVENIRQTLDLSEILATTTQELLTLLRVDRCLIFRFSETWGGEFVAEAVAPDLPALIGSTAGRPITENLLSDPTCLMHLWFAAPPPTLTAAPHFAACGDLATIQRTPAYLDLMSRLQAIAYLVVPIWMGAKPWGLLGVYQTQVRTWQPLEIDLLTHLASQLGIALQQADLLHQTRAQAVALAQARDAAEAASQAKGEFLARMSHELRTPLNAILGFAQLMSQDASLNPQTREYLQIIGQSGDHLLALISDVLDMAKIEAGQTKVNLSNTDLHGLLDSLEGLFRLKAATKGLHFSVQRPASDLTWIRTDETKLRQILINLLGNALKFTAKGAVHLTVSAQGSSDLRTDLIFTISDTGPGMTAGELATLFVPFSQATAGRLAQQGTGLGLAISQHFAQLLGGQVTVTTTPGQGSQFQLYLPVEISARDPSTAAPTFPSQRIVGLAPGEPIPRILVVDDQPTNRKLLGRMHTQVGFEVQEAENGQRAVELWEAWQPDLIWMDLQMPVLDGYQAAGRIKALAADKGLKPPVIIALTASIFDQTEGQILAAGFDGLVFKPYRPAALFQQIAHHLKICYQIAEPAPDPIQPDAAQVSPSSSPRPSLTLENLSPAWVLELHHAAQRGSDQQILTLLDQCSGEHREVTAQLRDWTQNFQFDRILSLTTPLCDHPS
ncbi:MAG: PAS domain-containing protein [Gloeomargaritaceae cyanobacterium C42_A2020_066]|nr:PAS domain-containing protein [Gloeomargaritaceae cyanobacterium C42_A2020_066]